MTAPQPTIIPGIASEISKRIDLAEQQLIQRKLCLVQVREQLEHLDNQIAEFLKDKTVPGRNAGIFLVQLACHLRGMANELDGGRA